MDGAVQSAGVATRFEEGASVHWFKPERFLEPDFDAEQYVADARRYVPLDTLAAELQGHLGTLRNRLVEVINEDYADFVSLSSKLVNVDSSVARMQRPLLDIQAQLLEVRKGVTGALGALREGLERRQTVAAARALLELMQDTAHVMSKVEKLLAEISAMEEGGARPGSARTGGAKSGGAAADLDARVRMFERLASEVARLNFYAARGKDLPFVEALEPRMEEAGGKLRALLRAGLADALRQANAPAQAHCLQAFAAVGDAHSAEQIVREVRVAPLVERALAEQGQADDAAAGSSGSSSASYAQVLDRLAGAVEAEVGPILEEGFADQAGAAAFNFLGASVLAEVDGALAAALPGAFSVGVPEKFVGNYRAAQAFLDRLEALCRSRGALEALRGSAAYASFQERWKLSVYFGLRFQNIAGGLDAVASAPDLAPAASGGELPNPLGLQLRAPLALQHALHRCLAPDVWLGPLADRLVRLALQLLARYATWLRAGLDARVGAAHAPADPALQPGQAESGWAVGARADAMAAVRADTDAVLTWTGGDLWRELEALLPFLPPQALASVRAALDVALGEVAAQAGGTVAAITEELAGACSGALLQLRGIVTTYRMTTRPVPTKASHYVGGVLAPLQAFLDGSPARRLAPGARADVVQGVVEGVSARFAAQAAEMLETLRKTESSLRRLRESRAGDAAGDGAGALSATDKVHVQLFLDAQEYGRQVAKFGLDPAQERTYRELWAAVAPPEQKEAVSL